MIPLMAIQEAAARLTGRVHRTPLLTSRTLGDCAGVALHLKCECLQKTGSFKPRGALNKILTLDDKQRQRGLITVSAGNHAQAVAWAAHEVGVPCCVVMPEDAPQSKLDAVRGYGAEIVLDADRSRLFETLAAERDKRGSTFIHPFDDPVVLAGAGTVGKEIVDDLPDVDWVFVPVGGGGLMAGVTSAVKAMRPNAKVVAVELAAGPGLQPALEAGKPVPVPRPAHTLADGMTPPFVGALPLEIARQAVDAIVTVTEEEIVRAMFSLVTRAKLFVEGSGAAATAAVLFGKVQIPRGAKVVSLVSGGNIDWERMHAAFATPTPLQGS